MHAVAASGTDTPKTALVTGANSGQTRRTGEWYSQPAPDPDALPRVLTLQCAYAGIGFVTSKELARQGYRVAMVCRDLEKGKAAKAQIL